MAAMLETTAISASQLWGAVGAAVLFLSSTIVAGIKWHASVTMARVAALEVTQNRLDKALVDLATRDMLTRMGDRLSEETSEVDDKLTAWLSKVSERVAVLEALQKKRTR